MIRMKHIHPHRMSNSMWIFRQNSSFSPWWLLEPEVLHQPSLHSQRHLLTFAALSGAAVPAQDAVADLFLTHIFARLRRTKSRWNAAPEHWNIKWADHLPSYAMPCSVRTYVQGRTTEMCITRYYCLSLIIISSSKGNSRRWWKKYNQCRRIREKLDALTQF